ncbi:hypothetical protein F2Q69_00060630 [Brassica cretica]|uniref:Uncharacterized protein n=1 Tax=Brassica cretica TaxID=69181 RepID=A0A8S9RQ09_BRACR|nr:hypothetical protein F2Q69_00060630 [Brassica cretica]
MPAVLLPSAETVTQNKTTDARIGVPHGVLGDIQVRLELKRGDKGDHWTSSVWKRPYRSDAMNSMCPTSQSDLTRATTRGR